MNNYHNQIELIYDSISRPEQWCELFVSLVKDLGCMSGLFMVVDETHTKILGEHQAGLDSDVMVAYNEHFSEKDIWTQQLGTLARGQFYASHEAVPQSLYLRSEMFNDFNRHLDIYHAAGAQVGVEGGLGLYLTLQRNERQGAFEPAEIKSLNHILPHLQRAVELQSRLNLLNQQVQSASGLLDRLPFGAFLVDESGRMQFMNAGAERLLAKGDALCLTNRRLIVKDSRTDQQLQLLIQRAVSASQGQVVTPGGNLRMANSQSGGCLELQVSPFSVDDCQFGFLASRTLALVLVKESGKPSELDPQCLVELYDLTPKETRVAIYLAKGLSPAQIAEVTFTSLNTVRTHLKALLSKTDTNSQSQLVSRLLSSLAVYSRPSDGAVSG